MRRILGMNKCVNVETVPSGTYHQMLENRRRPNLMASESRPDAIGTKEALRYSMERTTKGKIYSAQFARQNVGAVSSNSNCMLFYCAFAQHRAKQRRIRSAPPPCDALSPSFSAADAQRWSHAASPQQRLLLHLNGAAQS